MTRRLVDRIIPVMVEHLEGQTPEGMPSDLVQEMQQDRARQIHAEGGSEAPVAVEPEFVPWLCRTVHLTKTGPSLSVVFTDDTHIEAQHADVCRKLARRLGYFQDALHVRGVGARRRSRIGCRQKLVLRRRKLN